MSQFIDRKLGSSSSKWNLQRITVAADCLRLFNRKPPGDERRGRKGDEMQTNARTLLPLAGVLSA
jgi:hypothetical protein